MYSDLPLFVQYVYEFGDEWDINHMDVIIEESERGFYFDCWIPEDPVKTPIYVYSPNDVLVYQIRRQTSDDAHVLCGVYSSVQSIMDRFPYRTHSLRLSECSQYVIAEMVKEEWETYASPKIEFFAIIESKVM